VKGSALCVCVVVVGGFPFAELQSAFWHSCIISKTGVVEYLGQPIGSAQTSHAGGGAYWAFLYSTSQKHGREQGQDWSWCILAGILDGRGLHNPPGAGHKGISAGGGGG
jgi:hypothetical protein